MMPGRYSDATNTSATDTSITNANMVVYYSPRIQVVELAEDVLKEIELRLYSRQGRQEQLAKDGKGYRAPTRSRWMIRPIRACARSSIWYGKGWRPRPMKRKETA